MNEHILQLYIAMDDIFVVQVGNRFDELVADILHFWDWKGIVTLDILQERVFSTVFNHEIDLRQSLNTFNELKYSLIIQILHNIDFFANILEFVWVFVHLELLINFNRHELLNIWLWLF